MIDKVQKIREEVVNLFNHVKDSNFESDSGAFYYLKDLLEYIDSLQEETVSDDLEKAALEYATYYDKNWSEVKDGYIAENEVNAFKAGAKWQKERIMANSINATICLPYENKDGGYTQLVDVSRPLPVGDNKIAIIFKEE